MDLYNTSALFNQNMSKEQQDKFQEFYKKVFSEYDITTIHDCSVGAGGTTIPFARLGYQVSGSDLSENLLNKAKENFKREGYDVELFPCDFRKLGEVLPNTYDCIISTGNSLPHVNNQDVHEFIKNIATKINKDGLLFLDMRNWDKILKERPIFSARDPLVMTAEEHVSLYQIWNWHDDLSVDFIFVSSTDRQGKHEKTSILSAPTYYPLKFEAYEKMLNDNGFEVKSCFDVDGLWFKPQNEEMKTGNFQEDFDNIGWYAVLAQKVK
ncbi:class I SAM-dependent methyltransferase [Alkaliphilus hydrothermalis]|uniref:SAM-dependent methyltransferase n=1 Tax=Alkaliphilus hydrothermalis TaxID=1482730 RepID=A0ABS2NSP0_9FIRM|nr:class I SAM-dependent methyltransferase [Alkaliphilus hydrothermalis]MBM7615963.1 SAM-dependent methyltransferase [Alkaliphilus hydrothermalis]